ncbi:STAS domain-containing protein [Mycolicibacterium austroafricanum]|uniref:STAS domain-containing protein n=1 Tax=Mycolicibacterium austroafricanum TaxID=39687 RepID=A0ABT8HG33_MYCAO|nr:STAS domain-containing protein [Mycolicibacterium austroafricanum]MDN4519715.1 STAS domain-containing protein [Mycolicibacterium austroafricanum]PQP44091.1 anti-anti-sigma factor [Mycolicibacterium austroafricanum]QRZ05112.1 STAS domain-containing protein [Mycolicibacterium austroafricanum]QZT66423.1 STAS domain-containing protein [Mycolicibacterium austroafricanum]
MPTALTLDIIHRADGTVVLVADGEIDLSNVDEFSRALTAATAEAVGGAGLVADLASVEYVDSAAINVLSARAGQIGTLVVHPLLMTIFDISGLSELVTVEPAR